MQKNNYKKFKKVVDNKSKYFGDTDFDKHLIRINKHMNKTKGSQGELINTIVHERDHVLHPKMKEKNIQKLALKGVAHMSKKAKDSAYKPFEKKSKSKGSIISKRPEKQRVAMMGMI